MSMQWFVDANHAGDTKTRRSQTGILSFCSIKQVMIWFSKRQNSVKAPTFGIEFTPMKNTVEMTEALRCKLRMFGVPVDGQMNLFCDNGATPCPKSTLLKKHHSLACCHCSQDAVAAGTIRVSKEHTSTNLANLFTNAVTAPKREDLLDGLTAC
jgi:hypothetical protein